MQETKGASAGAYLAKPLAATNPDSAGPDASKLKSLLAEVSRETDPLSLFQPLAACFDSPQTRPAPEAAAACIADAQAHLAPRHLRVIGAAYCLGLGGASMGAPARAQLFDFVTRVAAQLPAALCGELAKGICTTFNGPLVRQEQLDALVGQLPQWERVLPREQAQALAAGFEEGLAGRLVPGDPPRAVSLEGFAKAQPDAIERMGLVVKPSLLHPLDR